MLACLRLPVGVEPVSVPGKREAVELHLNLCDGCTDYLQQLRLSIALAGELTEDALPPDTVPTADVINDSNSKALSVGTGSDANALPSFMETFLTVTDEAEIVVEHQVVEDVKGLYLQVNENNSVWHINARISIQRIS